MAKKKVHQSYKIGKASQIPKNEAYFSYSAVMRDAAQRRNRTFYEAINGIGRDQYRICLFCRKIFVPSCLMFLPPVRCFPGYVSVNRSSFLFQVARPPDQVIRSGGCLILRRFAVWGEDENCESPDRHIKVPPVQCSFQAP